MDLTFLQPMFLWAGLAVALPLMLHLLRQRQRDRQPFPTLRFLRVAQQRAARRIKIEHWLLWLLRTALVAALVFAFTMPVLRSSHGGDWLGRARRDVAIVLDASFSMTANEGGRNAWETAKETAAAVVKGLDEGDRVSLILAGTPARALFEQPTADREAVLGALKNLPPPGEGSRLDEAVALAAASLRDSKARECEIHILSDGQAFPWQGFKIGAGQSSFPPHLACFALLAGGQPPANTWFAEAKLDPPRPLAGQPAALTIRTGHSGTGGETTLSLEGLGNTPATRAVNAGTGTVTFPLPPQPAGPLVLRLKLPGDALPVDDGLALLVSVRDRLPVLCVGSETSTLFLGMALDPAKRGVGVAKVEPAALATLDLSAYETIFLADALPLPAAGVKSLGNFVRGGGVLVVFPGDRAGADAYASLADLLPALPVEIAARPAEEGPLKFRATEADPLLKELSTGPENTLAVGVRRYLRFQAQAPGSGALLETGDKQPLLLARTVGRGRCFLFTVSAERRWSTLPLSPAFLPLVHEIVRHGLGPDSHPATWRPQRHVPVAERLPGWQPGDQLFAPSGNRVEPQSVRTDAGEILEITDATEPGLWQRQRANLREPAFAVRTDPDESDLSPAKPDDLPKLTGLPRLKVAQTPEAMEKLIQEHRRGRPFAEPLLWIVLALAAAEWWVANEVHRRRQVKEGVRG